MGFILNKGGSVCLLPLSSNDLKIKNHCNELKVYIESTLELCTFVYFCCRINSEKKTAFVYLFIKTSFHVILQGYPWRVRSQF